MKHDRAQQWTSPLLIIMPALFAAHSEHLLTLELLNCHEGDVVLVPPPASATQVMTAALLSCRALRRRHITDWWLSTSVCAATSRALLHLESLEVDEVQGIDEATLAVLLDEAPRLHELRFYSGPLPYDMLAWLGVPGTPSATRAR